MDYSDAYKSTIESYKKLGKTYTDAIRPYVPEQFYLFIQKLVPGGRVLDVGCAGGRECIEFVKNGFEVVGIDMVEEFLAEAKKEVPQAEFLKMDLLDMSFPENNFDGIWASAVLLHIKKEDIFKALKNFYRILKPNGKLFVSVKRGSGSSYNADKLSRENRLMVFFSEEEIKELIQKAGYNISYFETVPDEAGRTEVKWIRLIAEKVEN